MISRSTPLSQQHRSELWGSIAFALLGLLFDYWLWGTLQSTPGHETRAIFGKIVLCTIFAGPWVGIAIASGVELRRRARARNSPGLRVEEKTCDFS